ncbi:Solute carrier family 26 member 6 [Nibea albiflora]|uniref:Solute carrier family 26 member 6 n=1 Tax=Nibea albiflora TaxID=240163 RepID=A0ACB7EKP5_NIBAL|nr:Solute carrier family 26 member 6 [Nibea albiflora]
MEKMDCSSGEYFVQRKVLDELHLDEVAQKGTRSTKPTVGERVKESLRCSAPRLKHTILSWVPVLGWLPHYSFRENAIGDLISGCSVGIMHLPQGTFAVVSIMIGSVTERLAPDNLNGTSGTNETDARDALRVEIACSLTVLTGIFQILLGVVRFGFVVTYLSEPLVRGYTTGSACHVCVSQLKYLFGVKPQRFTGPLSLIYTLVDICRLLPETKVPELVQQSSPTSAGLTSRYSIDVVGEIPSGLNAPRAPDATLFSKVIGDAFAIAIVGYAINISLGKTFALKHGYKVDSNQELVALGLSNTVGAFFQCYSVTSSLSRSLVQESTGGKTQVAGVISSIIVLITILKIGSLFEDLPKAVLSTIVFVNLKGMFKQFMDVPMLWKTNKVDLLVWLVTFISTILLNLDLGLAVSIGFSMLTVIFRTQLPRYSILGHVSGTDLYLDTEKYKQAEEIPGIKIFRSSATIYYTNAEMYLEALQEKSGIEIGKLLTVKKKQDARLKREQEKEKKKAKKEAKKQKKAVTHMSNGSLSLKESRMNEEKVSAGLKGQNSFGLTETSSNDHYKGAVNRAYQHDTATSDSDSDTGCHGDDGVTQVSHHSEEEKGQACGSGTHSIILDISATSFVDTATVKTLKNIFRDFGEIDLDIYLAGCQACVVEQLETSGFFSESIPKSRLFVTVHDAVLHILHKLEQTDFVLTLVDICRLLPETKVPELVVSLVALSVLNVAKEVNDCYRQKLPLPIPTEITVVKTSFSLIQEESLLICPAGGILTTVIVLD